MSLTDRELMQQALEALQDLLQEPRAWFTIDEINDWADKYEAKQKERP